MQLSLLYEVFAGSVIFMLLPNSVLSAAGSIFQKTSMGSGEEGLRYYSAKRVARLGDAFQDLYDTVRFTIERESNDNNVATIFDRAADSTCAKCAKMTDCWQRNYMSTLTVMNDATPGMLNKRKLDRSDLAEYFVEKCPSVDAFIGAVNTELRAMMYRRQYKIRLKENRAAAYGQFSNMASIMKNVAQELSVSEGSDTLAERRLLRFLQGMEIEARVSVFREKSGRLRASIESRGLGKLLREEDYLDKLSAVLGVRLCRPGTDDIENMGRLLLMEAEPLAVSVGIAAMKKKGQSVSGDRGTYFKTDQGVLCVILSDGMGSGEAAAQESVAAVRILESFLRSGVDPETAMKILNSVFLLKDGDDWGYATVDLMCIDLFSGETCFYKYGAAPSYVRNGKMIRRVRGQSFAAGVNIGGGTAPDAIKMKLKPGSLAIVGSDGVLADEEDSWLRSMLSGYEGADTKKLAREALQGAIRQYGCEDDMTVLAVYVDRRA